MNSKQKKLLIQGLREIKPDTKNIPLVASKIINKYEVTHDQKLDLKRLLRIVVSPEDCASDYKLLLKTIEAVESLDAIDPPMSAYVVSLAGNKSAMYLYTDEYSSIPSGHWTEYYTQPLQLIVYATSTEQAQEMVEEIIVKDKSLERYSDYSVIAVTQSLKLE